MAACPSAYGSVAWIVSILKFLVCDSASTGLPIQPIQPLRKGANSTSTNPIWIDVCRIEAPMRKFMIPRSNFSVAHQHTQLIERHIRTNQVILADI